MSPVNVSILGETAVGVSVTGNSTGVSVSVSPSTGVSVAATGGIGPAGFLTAPGTSTNAFGTFQLAAGNGITLSTANGQFLISSYDTASVTQLAPVKSVAGRTGDIALQAADITAGTFSVSRIPTISYTALSNVPQTFAPSAHTHSTADIVGITAFGGAAAPVQSVQGRTGDVVLSRLDLTAAANVHTHSTADIVGLTAAINFHSPVQSVAGRSGVITLTTADVSGLAAIATSGSASDLSSGSVPSARLPAATSTALGAVQVGSGLSISAGVLSATGGGGGGAAFVGVPTSASATGTSGTFAADSSYLYACYSVNNWLRVQRAEWRWTPGVPQSVSVSAADGLNWSAAAPVHNVIAEWSAPSDTGGGLAGYALSLNPGGTVTVSAQTLSYQWLGISAAANACVTYSVSVAAFNSAGTSSSATGSALIPNTTYPVNLYVAQTPNEGAPGVTYSASWTQVCLGGYNVYELQVRLYNSENGPSDNWETVGTPASNSFTHYISTATSTTVYEWRVRAIAQTNGTTTSSSIWSAIDTTPHL